jgi:hypothetical protein
MLQQVAQSANTFKQCGFCRHLWTDREAFLADPLVELIGYKADLEDLALGLFFFNHSRGDCMTTLGIETGVFLDLYRGPRHREIKTGGSECPGYCTRVEELRPCPARCRNAFVREIVRLIRSDPLAEASTPPNLDPSAADQPPQP